MSGFGNLRRYLELTSRRAARIKREVDEELRVHIDMRTEALQRSGLAPDEARARAIRDFGDLEDAAQYCTSLDQRAERRRGASTWLSELRQDAGHALRLFRRAPAFTAATVLTLALAIGAATAVYGVLHTYLVRPLPYPESDRLMFVEPPRRDAARRAPSLTNVDWSNVDSLFDAAVRWDLDGFTLAGGEYAENVSGTWVSPGYFRALSLRPTIGREFRAEEYRDQTPVAIISYGLWTRRFAANPKVIGSTITIHSADRTSAASSVTIVGVLPRDFWPIQWRESELIRPLPPEQGSMPILVRLKPDMSALEAELRLNAIVRAQVPGDVDSTWSLSLTPALTRHSMSVRSLLAAVFGAALFMLLASCGSVAGALVSRMSARQTELGIRLALGGGRARIVRQLLTESAVLAAIAGVLGLAFAYALLYATAPLIERLLGTSAPGGAGALRPSVSMMGMSLAASVVAGIGLGLIPALTFLRFERTSSTSAVLGAGRSRSARGGVARVRRILIACQVSVATMLMFGAGLMFQTVARMAATPLGFRVDGVMRANMILPEATYADSIAKHRIVDRVLARAIETPGVQNAAAVFPAPFGSAWGMPVVPEGSGLDQKSAPRATVFTATDGYFNTMGIPLRAGRAFRATDDQNAPFVAVISETLARRIAPSGNAIGRRIRFFVPYTASFGGREDLPWRTVVGVVGDTKKEFSTDAIPDVYVPYAQNPRSYFAIVVRSERSVPAIIEPVRRAVASVDPNLALFDVGSIEDIVAEQGGQRRGLTALLGAFATFALVLSALALYASLSYAVAQRRSELAVRMAVGASHLSILQLVMVEGLSTTVLGLVVGIGASRALAGVLEHQVYGVSTGDPATLVSIALVLSLAATAACAIPGLRAARTNPAIALRE